MTHTLGASEVAVVLGLGRQRQSGEPWVSELEVYARLTGLIQRYSDDGGPDAEVGRWVEHAIMARLISERGLTPGRDVWPGPPLSEPGWSAPGIPWHARPDGHTPWYTVECKAPRALYPEEWGDTEHDIPPYYAAQVLAQVAVAHALHGIERGVLAAMARAPGWGAPRVWAVYELARSGRRERGMVAAVERWLERHVERGIPPQPDGSESASWTLRRMFSPVVDKVHVATPTDLERWRSWLTSRDLVAELKGRAAEEQQHLQSVMGEATVLQTEDGTPLASWRADKNGTRRWRVLATETA